jgi:hypothetical protein
MAAVPDPRQRLPVRHGVRITRDQETGPTARVALIVHDERDYLHYVSIRGRAALIDEGEDALAEAMRQAERYGEDPSDFAGQLRVNFRVDPEHVHECH